MVVHKEKVNYPYFLQVCFYVDIKYKIIQGKNTRTLHRLHSGIHNSSNKGTPTQISNL
jgi:hypothetical protein